MLLTLIAMLAAFAASLTGLMAVGCGNRFRYRPIDLLHGSPIALAYVWTCSSTIASAFTATSLLDAAARGGQLPGVFALTASAAGSCLFAIAHVAIARWAERRNGVAA